MRKVMVIREMPFGKVGEIWESDNGYYGYLGYGVDSVKKMIQDGWLEEDSNCYHNPNKTV